MDRRFILQILIVIVASALIVNIYLLASQKLENPSHNANFFLKSNNLSYSDDSGMNEIVEKNEIKSENHGTNSEINEEETQNEIDKCLLTYSLDKSNVIFYYQDGEVHSMNMKPIVDSLKDNYSFYYVDELWNFSFNSCFGLSGAVPTFVCAGSREKIVGEVSEEELINFVSKCL